MINYCLIKKKFYKNIAFSPPIYGADARNTLFDKGIPWNLGELDCILKYYNKIIIFKLNNLLIIKNYKK